MHRSSFIKNLVGTFGLSVLPIKWIQQYQKIYLLQCFIRGFRFYKGENLLMEMKIGDILELVREPTNEFDECAIALHFNKEKIGFIPMESNEVLSRLMDAKVIELLAEITHIEKKADTWENVHIAVYVLKESVGPLPTDKSYLTQLETPHYYTLKYENDRVNRIYYDEEIEEDEYTADNFYEDMLENSSNDGVYNILHHQLNPNYIEKAIDEDLFITNLKDLPNKIHKKDIFQLLDDQIIDLNHYFNEDGLVVLNVQKLAKMPDLISDFVKNIP
jgi:hypothetical protein